MPRLFSKKRTNPISPILAFKMVTFCKLQQKILEKFPRAQNIFWISFAAIFFSFQNYSCQIFTQFSFKNCEFQPFYPPQNDTYVHVHNCKPPWVHLPHNCYAVHACIVWPSSTVYRNYDRNFGAIPLSSPPFVMI